jgi:hypothetical protein
VTILDAELDAVMAGLLDDALAAAHAIHWPVLARQLALLDKTTPEALAQIEAQFRRDYVVWKWEMLAQLRLRLRAAESIH